MVSAAPAAGDEHPERVRQAADQRGRAEQQEARLVDPAVAPQVAGASGAQEQHRRREHERQHHPARQLDPDHELAADDRQRQVDGGAGQRAEQSPEADDHQHEVAMRGPLGHGA